MVGMRALIYQPTNSRELSGPSLSMARAHARRSNPGHDDVGNDPQFQRWPVAPPSMQSTCLASSWAGAHYTTWPGRNNGSQWC